MVQVLCRMVMFARRGSPRMRPPQDEMTRVVPFRVGSLYRTRMAAWCSEQKEPRCVPWNRPSHTITALTKPQNLERLPTS